MEIGNKIKELRIAVGLTQEELAQRSELTKGFISQVERDLTSPSLESFGDILEALGTDPQHFFAEAGDETIVFGPEDYFEMADDALGYNLSWIVPNAQKNSMEPTLITLQKGGSSKEISPYEGEELGYVIQGEIELHVGVRIEVVREGETFYFHGNKTHFLKNKKETVAKVLWVSSPPNF
ncbi:MAG: XRE family transcriptional regulator [Tissierellia bacterium]|nr:XRE family transcriptional regulator [Tissierellia bacterium]